ncbi:hypothetical protein PQR01_00190 [Paraburkholderia rhynchosiae]|uniref:Uncharacterized protein n=1 Tax=Paraburkholderia rhynchosiae TaxID=487049 RepID=A0ACC7N2T5_9BURK
MTATTSKLGADMHISENDMARVLFANLFPRGMCPADWDSGAILGPDNIVRKQFLDSAREVLDFIARQPAAIDKQGAKACPECGGSLTTWKCLCDPIWPGYAAPLDKEASKPAATEGYAFRSDGKLWVVTDPVVAMKWQEQGFQVTPVHVAPSVAQDERGAFEAYMHSTGMAWDNSREDDGDGDEQYADVETRFNWDVWQARATSTPANVAQGAAKDIAQLALDWVETARKALKTAPSAADGYYNGYHDALAANRPANVAQGAKLAVCYGPMPESNGKTNWTAILHKGDLAEGHTIDRSEYPDRVRYAADCVRYLIGELKERPWILDYDADKHSGYVANVAQGAEAIYQLQQVNGAWQDVSKSEFDTIACNYGRIVYAAPPPASGGA